jgi:hypothetical protein
MPTHRSFPPPRYQTKKKHSPHFKMQTFYVALIGAGILGYVGISMIDAPLSSPAAALSGACNIKGNISINSRERINHVPGQEHYAETKISPQYGERWFCSEAEARAAGWRRAGR